MAKKRSPYEVEHVSTALGLRQSGVSSVGKAASLKKQKSAVPSSSFLLPDDVDGRTISRNNSEHGTVLVTDAECDIMNAVDAKLAALTAGGGTASPLKTQEQKYATGVNSAVSGYATPDHKYQTQPVCVHVRCTKCGRNERKYLAMRADERRDVGGETDTFAVSGQNRVHQLPTSVRPTFFSLCLCIASFTVWARRKGEMLTRNV
jgi:hypothetical protein